MNSINGCELEVKLEFSIGKKDYKIIRGIKPNIFEIHENGKLLAQDAAIKDYQTYLEQNILCGLTEKVFRQVVLISSLDYKPFMQLTTGVRREIVEELLDLKIFSSMSVITKNKLSNIKEQQKNIEFAQKLVSDRKVIYEQELSKAEQELQKQSTEKSVQIKAIVLQQAQLEAQIETHTSNIVKLEDQLKHKPGIQEKHKEASDIHSTLFGQLTQVNKALQLFTKQCSCPTCTRDIDEAFKEQMLLELTNKRDSTKLGLEKCEASLQTLNTKLETIKKLETLKLQTEHEIQKLDLKKTQYTQDIAKLSAIDQTLSTRISDFKTKISDSETELNKIKADKLQLVEDKLYNELILDMLKDGGIKTKIVKQYVPVMNKIINEYLNRFGLPIEFNFDDQFNEVIKSRYRDTFTYNNFSNGERARIDMALLFTWRQIAKLKNTVNCNLVFMDETYDSSLDGTASDELLNIILALTDDSNIYIISHRSDLSDKVEKTYEFSKNGNFTQMNVKL